MRRLLVISATALLSAALGCGDSGTGPASIAGTYNLKTVNGAPLPAVVFEDVGFKLEVTAGSYLIRDDGTFTSSASLRETEDGFVTTSTESFSGSYTRLGATLNFAAGGESWTGTVSGSQLTISEDGITVVYVR